MGVACTMVGSAMSDGSCKAGPTTDFLFLRLPKWITSMRAAQQHPQTRTTMTPSKRMTTEAMAGSSSFVGTAVGSNVVGTDVGTGAGSEVGTAIGTAVGPEVGNEVGIAVVGGAVGAGIGSAVGSPGAAVGDGIGTLVGAGVGSGVGGVVGAGDGGVVGSGDGAGVGENVATSTESALALAIDSRRAARRPDVPAPASRRPAAVAAVWISVVNSPLLTASPSTVITCECTVCSPGMSTYKWAMTASATRTSLVSVTPVPSSEFSVHSASSNVAFDRTASHATS